ncbi:hypothetical protein GCM10009560_11850 [Nonomuraea longicatena]|uniref:Uncharacterized protein n=1 Tax=Nonomuraea longicatena TaxID=83682 RepID=A0ABP3Z7A1_9ACTN
MSPDLPHPAENDSTPDESPRPDQPTAPTPEGQSAAAAVPRTVERTHRSEEEGRWRVDELMEAIYDPLLRRLRAELRLERERRGLPARGRF